jgi:hypothetical protein
MIAAVSPYHLTSREPPALAGLLLADRVVTVRPSPAGGATRRSVEDAASRAPAFARLFESWRWSEDLWRAGVIGATAGSHDAAALIPEAVGRILADPSLAPLRDLLRQDVLNDPERSLDAVARDILRAGPDPGMSVPVAAALDRLASRHGLVVMRSHPVSVAQRAEQKLAEPVFAAAIPLLVQAEGDAILNAREMLEEPLREFRSAMDGLVAGAGRTPEGVGRARAAAGALGACVERRRGELEKLAPPDRPRVAVSAVTLSAQVLPADAALRSSVTAARALSPARSLPAPEISRDADSPPILSIMVKML